MFTQWLAIFAQVNHEQADRYCRSYNMQLISIETKAEDDIIMDTLNKGGSCPKCNPFL